MIITTIVLRSSLLSLFFVVSKATNCENGWINLGRNCYLTNSPIVVTYSEAHKICKIMGAEVLTFNSTTEVNLLQLLENKTSIWIQQIFNRITAERSCSAIQAKYSQIQRKIVKCNSYFGFICEMKINFEFAKEEDANNCTKCRSSQRGKRSVNYNFPFQNRFNHHFSQNDNSEPFFLLYPHRPFRTQSPFLFATLPTPLQRPWIFKTQEPKGDHSPTDAFRDDILHRQNYGIRSIPIRVFMNNQLKTKLTTSKVVSAEVDETTTVLSVDEIDDSNNNKISDIDSDVPLDLSLQKNFEKPNKLDIFSSDITKEIIKDSSVPKVLLTNRPTITTVSTLKPQFNISTATSTTTTTTSSSIPTTTISKNACRDNNNHFKFYGICYYFEAVKKKTWEEAKESCTSVESSSLASFHSKYEYESVMMILSSRKLIQSDIWIGYHVLNQNLKVQWNKTVIAQQSRWVNGDPILFPGWWKMKLDISKGFCGAASEDVNELWSLRNCQLELPYLCSYRTDTIEFFDEEKFCEFGWFESDGWCYKYHRELKTWRDAEESCIVLGGHLPSILSEGDVELLRSFLCSYGSVCASSQAIQFDYYYEQKLSTLFWVGYFVDPNGTVIWVDGLNTSFYQWVTDDSIKENTNQYCGQTDYVTMQLTNHTCDSYLPYVCKRKRGHFTNAIPFDQEMPIYCPNDKTMTWHRNGDRCYKVFLIGAHNSGKTFKDAMETCQREGSHLASVESYEENYFILSQLTHADSNNIEVWISGKRSTAEGRKFHWMNENTTTFQYVNWAKGEPNNNDNMEDCVTIYPLLSGQWNDDHCSKSHGWICERSLNHSKEYVTNVLYPSSGSCPKYWTKIDLKCVRLYSYEQRDYDKARELCSKHHVLGDVVTIENVKQQALITALLAIDKKSVWIGLREVRDKFYWPDQNVLLNYTNWGKHQRAYHRTCVTLLTNGEFAKWSQTSCSANSGYVCQMPVDPKLKETSLLPFQTTCAPPYDSFFYFEGDCYSIIERAESWEIAEKSCQKLGAHLASVLLTKENSFLFAQFSNLAAVKNVWIGLKRLQPSHRYIWSDNWPHIFSNLGDAQLSSTEDENCVAFSMKDGTWSLMNCEQLNFFVCKQSKLNLQSTEVNDYSSCKSNEWFDFGGDFCYFMDTNEQMPSDIAERFCRLLGGALVSIHTHEEMQILGKLAELVDTSIWIGLKRQEGAFHWLDNSSSLAYVNWAQGEPNNAEEQCVEMLAGSGLWNDLKCDLLRGVLCKGPKVNGTVKKIPLAEEITYLPNSTDDLLKVAKITRSNAGRLIGINLGVLVVILAVVAAGAFGYSRYRRGLLLASTGGYGFDNVSYNLNNREPTSIVLGDDPLEHKYHEAEGILGGQSEDDESDGDEQTDSEKVNIGD